MKIAKNNVNPLRLISNFLNDKGIKLELNRVNLETSIWSESFSCKSGTIEQGEIYRMFDAENREICHLTDQEFRCTLSWLVGSVSSYYMNNDSDFLLVVIDEF